MLSECDEREKLLRAILDNSLTVVYLKDMAGRYILINRRYEELFHISRERITGLTDYDIFPAEIAGVLRSNDMKVIGSGGPVEFEEVVAQDDGLHTYISVKFPIFSPGGEPFGICGISTDITGRKEIEEELRTAVVQIKNEKAKTEAIIAAIGDGISIQDTNFKILYQNNRQVELIGRHTGEYCYEAYERRESVCDPCPIAMSFRDGGVHTVERWAETDRGLIIVEITASPLLDSAGNVVAGIEAIRDITARRKAEEELKKSREQMRALAAHLQSVREEERTIVAREIHDELAQALTVLKMDLTDLSIDIEGLGPGCKALLLPKVLDMSGNIDGIIETVHRIAMELRPSLLDDIGLMAAVEWQAQEFQKRTRIQCRMNSNIIGIIDRDRATALFRIFQETLTNVVRHANASRVDVDLYEGKGSVILKVADNGCGIDDKRISDSRSLGLMGMKERVEMFGGKISFKGVKRKGTTVEVSIPYG